MTDKEKLLEAAGLAKQALDCAMSNEFSESERLYSRAIEIGETVDHYCLADFYHQMAEVKRKQNEMSVSLNYHEDGLRVSLKQNDNKDDCISVALSRYFLAEHLYEMSEFERSIEVATPSLNKSKIGKRLIKVVLAKSLWKLGDKTKAKQYALDAVETTIDEKKSDVRETLAEILE